MEWRTASLTIFCCLLSQAGWTAPPGYALIAQTAHMSFYRTEGTKLHVEAEKTEQFLSRTARELGMPLDIQVEYFRHTRPEDIAAVTGRYAIGVTLPAWDEIHSTREFHPHELVHVLSLKLGNPGPLFNEGLAVALGDKGKRGGWCVNKLSRWYLQRVKADALLRALLRNFDRVDEGISPALAGSFVQFLIKKHGLPTMVEFIKACRVGPSARDAAFERTFGTALDQAAAEWADSLQGGRPPFRGASAPIA
jgi:hypothetical protein